MAVPSLTARQVDELLSTNSLSAVGRYAWSVGSNRAWARLEIPLKPAEAELRLVLTVNLEEPSKRSFSLLYRGEYRIRALDVDGSHQNKHTDRARWVGQTHKHRWTDRCRDRYAYTPIDILASDVEDQLAEFCAECGVSYGASIDAVPAGQGELFDEV